MEPTTTDTRSNPTQLRLDWPPETPETERFPSLLRGRRNDFIVQVKDVKGEWWDVRDARATKHGFDLLFGIPSNNHGAYRGGLARLITTEALRDFWRANRLESHGFLFDLPAGRTTLKRARKRLGFNFRHDTREFWMTRIGDLQTLTRRQFAQKHGVDLGLVAHWRVELLGLFARPVGWWRTSETIGTLLSGKPMVQIGRALGISTSHVHRLRLRARQESQKQCESQLLAGVPAVRPLLVA